MRIDFYKELSGMDNVDFSIPDVRAIHYRPNGELVIRLTSSDGYVWSPVDRMVMHHPVDEDDDCLDEFQVLAKHGIFPTFVIRSE